MQKQVEWLQDVLSVWGKRLISRAALMLQPKVLALVFFVLFSGSLSFALARPTRVEAVANASQTINFQAQLEQSSGIPVGDGNFNIEFKLYDGEIGGTPLWTESYLNAQGKGIKVKKGYVYAKLGSLVKFPKTMNWNQQLWLTMNVGGTTATAAWDGEMNPRLQLTAVPFAFQANQLSNLTGSSVSTLGWADQTQSNNILLPNKSGTLCIAGDAEGCGFASAVGSGNYIQNGNAPQSGASFNIDGSGTIGGNLMLSGSGAALMSSVGRLDITMPSGDLNLSTTVSGSIALQSAGDIRIAPSATGKVVIGNSSGTGSIEIGNSDAPQAIMIGLGNGDTTVTVAGGPGDNIVNIGAALGATNKVTIGNTEPTSVTTIRGGSLELQTSSYTATIGKKGIGLGGVAIEATGDLSFGGDQDRSINTLQSTIGKGATLNISAGQGAGPNDNGGDLVLQAGAAGSSNGGSGTGKSGSVVARANGSDSSTTPTFAVQNSNSLDLLAAYTGNGLIKIGNGTPTMLGTGNGDLYVTGSAQFGVSIMVGTAQDGLSFFAGLAPSAINGFFNGSSRPTKTISRVPQFSGMTTTGNTKGTLSNGFDTTNNAFRSFYGWTTTDAAAQTESMYVQIAVPRDFSALPAEAKLCFNVYTDDISGASGINTTFFDSVNTSQSAFNATPTEAGKWQQKCTTNIGGTITANGTSYVTVQIDFKAAPGKTVRLSDFSFDYLSAF